VAIYTFTSVDGVIHGLIMATPVPSESARLRVTTFMPWTSAV